MAHAYILYGASGSGKGTQAKLLQEKITALGGTVIYVETGKLARDFVSSSESYLAKRAGEVLAEGGLFPAFLPIWIWTNYLGERFSGKEYIVLDGVARRENEAPILHDALTFLNVSSIHIIVLNVSLGWAKERLENRGRSDDRDEKDIESRLHWYEENVVPAINYFRSQSNVSVHDINGEQPIEKVHEDILLSIGSLTS